MGGNETMTEKRFKLRKDGKIEWWHEHPTNIYVCPNMEYATEILNEQDQQIKELENYIGHLQEHNIRLLQQLEKFRKIS